MLLHNRMGRPQLLARLNAETFKRRTLSFYRYVKLDNPQEFRDMLYQVWDRLQCYGRIYIANEGINAQMSVPEFQVEAFLEHLNSLPQLENMPIKWAIEDDGRSFLKLAIKVRKKIVADGLIDEVFDVTNVGTHLSPMEFHELSAREDVIVVDMRNHYESEVGRFENALCPKAETFREEVEMVVNQLAGEKDRKILLYCTGGVRCEKASAWMRHHGFSDVNQLYGGIIAYASAIRQNQTASRFIGKNFVFDERLGERITEDIISQCHTCGQPCDTHINCAWNPCHKLFIQCTACSESYHSCCSADCKEKIIAEPNPKLQHRYVLQGCSL